ncbi:MULTISPECIES: transglutaminase family protein [unclassified Mesorhizobium]|uniref:transglutaminase family protein n=1 Tax=unclassified Mesorhizobium TaxID=325217 RepID=UPI001092E622|nr:MULTISPECIES: transglutaminase family protein [unclassified Mesorhizobium]TGP85427.1 transglutaminase domain-containing protein [Mesorhizobium sp. M8A.F.Ca.ET.218.01.1.1]TGT14475.1 transglutaminase domain-containing protein [Mesorhizobium sp. M8A.F.Ca.ET.213.01.1.1]
MIASKSRSIASLPALRSAIIAGLLLLVGFQSAAAGDLGPSIPAAFVWGLVNASEGEIDFGRAKLAVDKFVDPAIDDVSALAKIDRMVGTVNKMLATLPPDAAATSMEKMKALRTYLYEGGWWNNGRPFEYDHSDPYGQKPGSQSLTNYLATRKGNCVSMPALFVTLGQRLGINVTLSTAPLHAFVKFTDSTTGKTWNLETTSGAGFTRDIWYREKLPMTDEAIANGVYLKTLSRREALSVLATPVLDYLLETGRYEDAIAVADVLIDAYPANAYTLVKKGTAYYRLLDAEIIKKYPKQSDIPADKVTYANELYQANKQAFATAEALGWRDPKLN